MPALQGKAFDRGPTLCDMPHPIWATLNIPNTFVREGDWKMYRFWHDNPADQSHRYELYNVRKDISEKNSVAAENPNRVKKMSAVLDKFYKDIGVLGYNPNSKYNKCTVGTWFAASDEGSIAAKDGALVMKSDKPGFTVKNRFFPPGGREGFIAFEGRSSTGTQLYFAGPGKGAMTLLAKDWRELVMPASIIFLDRNKFAVSLAKAGEAEIRNVRILTADKTEMMRYTFY